MVDAGDKHQLAAHDPLGDMFIFRHIVPAYGPLQPLLSRPQTQGGESLKGQRSSLTVRLMAPLRDGGRLAFV